MYMGILSGVYGPQGADLARGKPARDVSEFEGLQRVKACVGVEGERHVAVGLALLGTPPVVTPLLLQLDGFSEDAAEVVDVKSPGAPRPRPDEQKPVLN